MEPMSNTTSARRDVATANCLVRIRAPVLCQRLQPATPDRPSQIADIDAVDRQHTERHERAGSFTTRRRRTVAAVFTIRRWSASKSTRSPVHTTNSPSSTQSTRNWASRAPTPSGNLSVNSLPFRDHNRTLPSLATAPARASHPTSPRSVTPPGSAFGAGIWSTERASATSTGPASSAGIRTPAGSIRRRAGVTRGPCAAPAERRPHHDHHPLHGQRLVPVRAEPVVLGDVGPVTLPAPPRPRHGTSMRPLVSSCRRTATGSAAPARSPQSAPSTGSSPGSARA